MLIAVTGHPPASLACGVDDAATYRSQAAREIPGYSKEDGIRTQPDDQIFLVPVRRKCIESVIRKDCS
jgi:hypothetical protein